MSTASTLRLMRMSSACALVGRNLCCGPDSLWLREIRSYKVGLFTVNRVLAPQLGHSCSQTPLSNTCMLGTLCSGFLHSWLDLKFEIFRVPPRFGKDLILVRKRSRIFSFCILLPYHYRQGSQTLVIAAFSCICVILLVCTNSGRWNHVANHRSSDQCCQVSRFSIRDQGSRRSRRHYQRFHPNC